jgi:hypothetical protein
MLILLGLAALRAGQDLLVAVAPRQRKTVVTPFRVVEERRSVVEQETAIASLIARRLEYVVQCVLLSAGN